MLLTAHQQKAPNNNQQTIYEWALYLYWHENYKQFGETKCYWQHTKQKSHITAIRRYMNKLATFTDMRIISILVNQNVTDDTKQKPHITAIGPYMNELSTFTDMRIKSISVNQNVTDWWIKMLLTECQTKAPYNSHQMVYEWTHYFHWHENYKHIGESKCYSQHTK